MAPRAARARRQPHISTDAFVPPGLSAPQWGATARIFPSSRRAVAFRKAAVVAEHGLQQDLRTDRTLLFRRELGLVVAHAVAARHEHHGGRRDAGNIGGVV